MNDEIQAPALGSSVTPLFSIRQLTSCYLRPRFCIRPSTTCHVVSLKVLPHVLGLTFLPTGLIDLTALCLVLGLSIMPMLYCSRAGGYAHVPCSSPDASLSAFSSSIVLTALTHFFA
jgi:hypothetical protein